MTAVFLFLGALGILIIVSAFPDDKEARGVITAAAIAMYLLVLIGMSVEWTEDRAIIDDYQATCQVETDDA